MRRENIWGKGRLLGQEGQEICWTLTRHMTQTTVLLLWASVSPHV